MKIRYGCGELAERLSGRYIGKSQADRTRFPFYLHNQLSYREMDTITGFSASNRSGNNLK